MTELETERLLLRPFTPGDAKAAWEMNLDPEVSRYTGDGGVGSLEEMQEILRTTTLADYERHGFGRHAVIRKGDGRFIGFCGLKFLEDMQEVDLGYRFLREYWGRGIATESGRAALDFGFRQLGLQRIIGLVMPQNAASVRVLEKLGFEFEQAVVTCGLDAHCYAIGPERWAGAR